MIGKAKCKKCLSTIEPIINQIVTCKCGEITLEGVSRAVICATSTDNYIEIDDQGNELKEKIIEAASTTRLDRLQLLDDMIETYERLPEPAMMMPVNNYELLSVLLLVRALLSDLESLTSLKNASNCAKDDGSID